MFQDKIHVFMIHEQTYLASACARARRGESTLAVHISHNI